MIKFKPVLPNASSMEQVLPCKFEDERNEVNNIHSSICDGIVQASFLNGS